MENDEFDWSSHRPYLLIRQCHKTNTNIIIEKSFSQRALLERIEEILDDYTFSIQGESKPFYTRATHTRNSFKNIEQWYYANSYGVVIQTYSDPSMFTLWNRKRNVGWFSNYWIDEKIFTLFIVGSCAHASLNFDYYDCSSNKQKLPFLDELLSKIKPKEI